MKEVFKFIDSNNIHDDLIISFDTEGNPYSYYGSDNWCLWSLGFNVSFSRLSGTFKSTVKYLVHKVVSNDSLKSKKSAVKNIIEGAVIFEKCITGCNGGSYVFIDDDEGFRRLLIEAKSKRLKFKTWKNNLIFLSHLYDSEIINREIKNYEELALYLSVSGASVSQAVCIPESIASTYYGEALKIIEDYYPYRNEISSCYNEFVSEYFELSKKYKSNISARKYALKKIKCLPGNIDIQFDYGGSWLSWLRGACYTVIAAFTGCRDGEIKSFDIDSYQEKKYAGMTVPVLHGLDTKPHLGGVARHTSWVTIPSVKKAILLLWDAFSFARKKWREKADSIAHPDERKAFLKKVDSLFITLPYMRGNRPDAGRQSLSDSLNSFVKSIGYRATKNDVQEFDLLNPSRKGELKIGEILKVHPHAFRRTFAVYLVRNKLASLLDIKYQFKHMNIAMTSWYANQANIASYVDMMIDKDLQDEIAGENQNYMTDLLYHVYNEAETLAGHEGKRIKNLRAEGDTRIYLNREEIRKQVQDGRLSIVEHPGGYCTNPDCDRICDMTTCQYKIVTKDKATMLANIREKLIIKYTDIESLGLDMPNVTSKLFYEIRAIEQVLSEHHLAYVAFNKKDAYL
ncbi:site-specific integrase [Salmonella enterica subsp. enterica serovar Coeln]|nr:site-specific integrase [Salmonella enterica subsp. enterica serovar Coeln]